jgi:hypothetical protein
VPAGKQHHAYLSLVANPTKNLLLKNEKKMIVNRNDDELNKLLSMTHIKGNNY